MPPKPAAPTKQDLMARRQAAVAQNKTGKITRPSVPPAKPIKPIADGTAVKPLGPKKVVAPVKTTKKSQVVEDDDEDEEEEDDEIIEGSAVVVTDDEDDDEDLDGDTDDDDEEDDEPAPPPPPVKPAKKAQKKAAPPPPEDDEVEDDEEDDEPVINTSLSKPKNAGPTALAIPVTPRSKQMTQRDRIIPRLALAQSMSKVAKEGVIDAGNWYHTVSREDLGEQILFVPVDWSKSRSLFTRTKGVVCRSFDLIKGEGTPGIMCEGESDYEIATVPEDERGCPNRLWTEDEDDVRKPPKCGIAHNYFGLILDNADPVNGPVRRVLLTFRSTASKTAQSINTIVSDSADNADGDEEGEYQWHKNIILLSVVATSRNGNDYFTPTAEFYGVNEGAALRKAEAFAAQISTMNVRTSLEARDEE